MEKTIGYLAAYKDYTIGVDYICKSNSTGHKVCLSEDDLPVYLSFYEINYKFRLYEVEVLGHKKQVDERYVAEGIRAIRIVPPIYYQGKISKRWEYDENNNCITGTTVSCEDYLLGEYDENNNYIQYRI